MRTFAPSRRFAPTILAFATAILSSHAAAVTYRAVQVVSPQGSPLTALAINNSVQVAGRTGLADDPTTLGFRRTGTGTMSTFTLPNTPFFTVTSMNDDGNVAAVGGAENGVERAVYKLNGASPKDIFPNEPLSYSEAYGINALNQVVGTYRKTSSTLAQAFMYNTSNGRITWLGAMGGGESVALGINVHNHIVGYTFTAARLRKAFLYQDRVLAGLPSLGSGGDTAYAINDSDMIVGSCHTTPTRTTACKWVAGQVSDMGNLGGTQAGAEAVNANGRAVGWSRDQAGTQRAVVFGNGTVNDLNGMLAEPIGARLIEGLAINDFGQIIALDTQGRTWQLDPN